jgi:hypothetical protein
LKVRVAATSRIGGCLAGSLHPTAVCQPVRLLFSSARSLWSMNVLYYCTVTEAYSRTTFAVRAIKLDFPSNLAIEIVNFRLGGETGK